MTADDAPAPDPREGVFDMDPQAVLVNLARTLVNGHATLLESRRAVERARSVQDAAPEAAEQLIATSVSANPTNSPSRPACTPPYWRGCCPTSACATVTAATIRAPATPAS